MKALIVGLTVALQVGAADEGWEDSGTKNGVALAYRDNRLLDAREVRATTELPFAVEAIVPAVCDLTLYTTLVPGVREARLIDGTIPTGYEVYLRYSPRYLIVAARDVVLRIRQEEGSPKHAACTWSESEERVPPRQGTVRMPLLRGAWTIERIDAARSRVTYQVAARPGGRIPAWLVRRGAIGALPDIIGRVHDELRRRHAGATGETDVGGRHGLR